MTKPDFRQQAHIRDSVRRHRSENLEERVHPSGVFICVLTCVICTVSKKKKNLVQKSLQFSVKTEPLSLPWRPAVRLLSPERQSLPFPLHPPRLTRLVCVPERASLPCFICHSGHLLSLHFCLFRLFFSNNLRRLHASMVKVVSSF